MKINRKQKGRKKSQKIKKTLHLEKELEDSIWYIGPATPEPDTEEVFGKLLQDYIGQKPMGRLIKK